MSATSEESPRKKKAVFKSLAVKLFPGETIFKKKVQKNTVEDFYCSDIISVMSPSMKDKHIICDKRGCNVRDENGDTVKLQRRYMMYTLSKDFEMFCEQHPETKIS